jgi:hypothetical protein
LFDDDTIELDDSIGWEPLTYQIDRAGLENEMALSLTLEPVLP